VSPAGFLPLAPSFLFLFLFFIGFHLPQRDSTVLSQGGITFDIISCYCPVFKLFNHTLNIIFIFLISSIKSHHSRPQSLVLFVTALSNWLLCIEKFTTAFSTVSSAVLPVVFSMEASQAL
jgi:hypothetical protein